MFNFPKRYNRWNVLADIINAQGLTKVVELGVWNGRTFGFLLNNCADVTVIGVDTWSKRPENSGIDGGETYSNWDMDAHESTVKAIAKTFHNRSVIYKMETVEASKLIPDGSIDLVFIDADHSARGVSRDIEHWLPKVRKGGFLTGHDIDWPTVKEVVSKRFEEHEVLPDNVWLVRC